MSEEDQSKQIAEGFPLDDMAAYELERRERFSALLAEVKDEKRIAALESEVAALRAELAQHKASLPTCEKHKPDRGARSGCVICSGHALSHALSRIDYACGEPNEMECSDYDVHYNEDEVVKRVVALRAEVEGMRNALGQARFCINELVPAGKDREFTLKIINAAIAARKESNK